jgi:hypothetical protein
LDAKKYAELLIKNGFVKESYMHLYDSALKEKFDKIAEEKFDKDAEKEFKDKIKKIFDEHKDEWPDHADQESIESGYKNYDKTEFPRPLKRMRLIWDSFNLSVEEPYFWLLNNLRENFGYTDVDKIIDIYSAAENSAFFGVTQMRLGAQQDKVTQLLTSIGKMVKDLFQIVRELRIIDERLLYYRESLGLDENYEKVKDGFKEASEITLKDIWISQVQGGTKNPASIFGLAREVGFMSLPDLFFSTHPQLEDDVDEYVEKHRGGFNPSLKNVLKRSLKMYLEWKKRTFQELKVRRGFTLKYLKQHSDIIKMYIGWVKPYLRHIRKLTLDENKMETVDLVSSFEGSLLETEYLAKKKSGDAFACVLVHILFRTRPSLAYQQEGYQRGAIHVGMMILDIRGYAMTKEEIERYKQMRQDEDFELIRSISESVAAAMDALGKEFEDYLREAEGAEKKKEKEEKKETKLGFWESFKIEFVGAKKAKPKKPKKKESKKIDKKNAEKEARATAFNLYRYFKKGHGMVQW